MSLNRLSLKSTLFFLCDIQSGFIPLVEASSSLKFIGQRMVNASQILNCPLIVTEQYPKALGKTVITLPDNTPVFEKMRFSMIIPEIEEMLSTQFKDYKTVVLFGLEAHVCVQQTCLDLLEKGYEVTIVADGTTSQRSYDRRVAFNRMKEAGAVISTSESVLFELMKDATYPNFKEISKLCNTKFVGPIPDPEYTPMPRPYIHSTPQKTLLQTLNHSKEREEVKFIPKKVEADFHAGFTSSDDLPYDVFDANGSQRYSTGQYPPHIDRIINTQRIPSRSIWDVQKQDAFDRYSEFRQTEHHLHEQMYEKGSVFQASTTMLRRKQRELLTGYNFDVEWLSEDPGDFTMRHALSSKANLDPPMEMEVHAVPEEQIALAMQEMHGIGKDNGRLRRKWNKASTIKNFQPHHHLEQTKAFQGVPFPVKPPSTKSKSVNRSQILKKFVNSTQRQKRIVNRYATRPGWNDDTKAPALFSAFALGTVEEQKRNMRKNHDDHGSTLGSTLYKERYSSQRRNHAQVSSKPARPSSAIGQRSSSAHGFRSSNTNNQSKSVRFSSRPSSALSTRKETQSYQSTVKNTQTVKSTKQTENEFEKDMFDTSNMEVNLYAVM